jgi:hypothetical protein
MDDTGRLARGVSHESSPKEGWIMLHRVSVRHLAAIVPIVAIGFAAACSSDANQPDEIANVRIVNASVGVGPITANTEGRTIQTNVIFQTSALSGSCGTIEKGGDAEIDFVAAGTTNGLGSVKANFVPQLNYTAVFYAANNAVVYLDQFSNPSTGNNAIRFINATGTAGDIYLTTPSANITGSPTVSNLAQAQASGATANASGGTFAQYTTDLTRVRLFNVGQTTGTPRVDFTIQIMPSNRVATVLLTAPPAGNSSPTAFMVGPCGS